MKFALAHSILVVVALYLLLNAWVVFIQWAVSRCIPLWFCS